MTKSYGIIAGIALCIAAIGAIIYTITIANTPNSFNSGMASTNDKADTNKYATLTGDEFDEAFIADMIAHHDGAVNMAEQAQAMTAREEIRELAGDITETQSIEIMSMRTWQQDWGYEITSSAGHMSHGGDGAEMAHDMTEMMDALRGLEGEQYDREFLKQMIIHHQQAIDMARYADKNAKHQELKDLAKNIIAAQETEIAQMRQWQQEWGY